jgi:pimeloyl-ACP methyl ester carboxylesterase
MTGLREPPKEEQPSRAVLRVFTLVLLAGIAGVVIYSAVINQRIGVTETLRLVDLERNVVEVEGIALNLYEDSQGQSGVVLLHDDEASGSLLTADLSTAIGDEYRRVRIDLPGFGLSDRMPETGPGHTVTEMADRVAEAIRQNFIQPVVILGVGFGGEVAAEVALVYPDLIAGVVLVDTDFEASPTLQESFALLPGVGTAATYTWETGGRLSESAWAPYCDEGGWCPSVVQRDIRATLVRIQGTSQSLNAFRRTPTAALAGSNLGDIPALIAYVRSTRGAAATGAVEFVRVQVSDLLVFESDSFQAHLEDPATVIQAIEAVTP